MNVGKKSSGKSVDVGCYNEFLSRLYDPAVTRNLAEYRGHLHGVRS
jgi:hypothetical protein